MVPQEQPQHHEDESASLRHRQDLTSRVVAIVTLFFLAIFFFFTVNNVSTVSFRVNLVNEGPYPVSVAAGQLETRLVQIRTVSDRLTYVRTPQAIEGVDALYDSTIKEVGEHIDFIESHHLTNPSLVQNLVELYPRLIESLNALVSMAQGDSNDEEITLYLDTKVYPVIDEMLAYDQTLLDESTDAVADANEAVVSAGTQTIIISCILMTLVILSIAIYIILLTRNRQREMELNKNLQDALKLAEKANAAKSTFLSNMSHDIRTPMNAIVGLTTIALANKDNPDRVEDCLKRISNSSKHLLSLINDVLDMGTIESGKIVLSEETFNFSDFIQEFVSIIAPQARIKSLNFDVVLGTIAHKMVYGDTMRINQVLMNLISNALKYTPAGGSVKLIVTEHEGTKPDYHDYHFRVEDTGIGIDQEFLAHIFDPFERERTETIHFTEGTGLGLAITKNVIELMGGTIKVESKAGEGTAFTVILPLKVSSVDVLPDTDANLDSDAPLTGRVLLVEDNELNREIAYELISQFGPKVETAVDGLDAIEKIGIKPEGYYSLVFMDWQMPRMDGITATQTIIAHERDTGRSHVPIVAMTANAFNEDRVRAMEVGMDGFMAKPINIKELEQNLRKFLG